MIQRAAIAVPSITAFGGALIGLFHWLANAAG